MKYFSRKHQLILRWVLIPIILLYFLEHAAHLKYSNKMDWFESLISKATERRIDFIFIGTSRTEAAIDADIFSQQIESSTKKRPITVNMGRGYTKIAQYYFGLRELLRQRPERLNGCVVFLEALEGIPSFETWNDSWLFQVAPFYITPYLHPGDIQHLWRTKLPIEEKILITRIWFTNKSWILKNNGRIRTAILQKGTNFIQEIYKHSLSLSNKKIDRHEDQIAFNAKSLNAESRIERVRELAISEARFYKSNQRAVEDWDKTILAELVRLIYQNGGKLVFFKMPLSSVWAEVYQTQVRKKDQGSFMRQAQIWQAPFLDPIVNLDDEDFPDLWHLDRSKSEEFTIKLAEAFMKSYYK